MTYSKHSSRPPEEVDRRLREAAQRHKFGILHVHDLKSTLQSKGIDLGAEYRIFDFCNSQAPSKALHAENESLGSIAVQDHCVHGTSGCTIATFTQQIS